MEPNVALIQEFVDEILELSASAHVRRRMAAKDSPEFYALNGAISAYGSVLAILTVMRRLEESYAKVCEQVPEYSQWVS